MQRGKLTSLLLAVCMLLLVGMTAFLSVFPVNKKVVDNETAVKQNELLISLQLKARDQIMNDTDENGLPMLYLCVPEERLAELVPADEGIETTETQEEEAEEPEPVPAWATLKGEATQESYAELTPEDVDEDGCRYTLTLKEINRKGRLHNNKLPLLDFEAGAKWVLSCRGGSGLLLPSEEGEAKEAAVHLVINGEDMGRCLVSPSVKGTDESDS